MRIIMAVQYLREKTGLSITINNWATGGQYKESGLRRMDTTTGARWSQHKYGRALDLKVSGKSPKEVHAIIHEHSKYLVDNQLLTTVENVNATPTWTHIDCRYTGLDRILVVNP